MTKAATSRRGNSRTSWWRICARRSRRYGSAEIVRWTARVACASSAALCVHEVHADFFLDILEEYYNTTRKGQSRGTPDFVSHDTDRWALDLLPRSRPARCADAAPAARLSLVLADVRAALRPAYRALSPGRARLPGLRPQRLARPAAIR